MRKKTQTYQLSSKQRLAAEPLLRAIRVHIMCSGSYPAPVTASD